MDRLNADRQMLPVADPGACPGALTGYPDEQSASTCVRLEVEDFIPANDDIDYPLSRAISPTTPPTACRTSGPAPTA